MLSRLVDLELVILLLCAHTHSHVGYVLVMRVLGRWRQEALWGSLASQCTDWQVPGSEITVSKQRE